MPLRGQPRTGEFKGRMIRNYQEEDAQVFRHVPEAMAIWQSRTLQELLSKAPMIYNYPVGSMERHRCCDAYNTRLSKLWHPTETDFDVVRNRQRTMRAAESSAIW